MVVSGAFFNEPKAIFQAIATGISARILKIAFGLKVLNLKEPLPKQSPLLQLEVSPFFTCTPLALLRIPVYSLVSSLLLSLGIPSIETEPPLPQKTSHL